MELVSFRPVLQAKLEEFLKTMQESRGHEFDRANLPQDIKDIKSAYQNCGGDFWVVEDNNSVVASIALRTINPEEGIGEIKRYFVLPAFQRRGMGGKLMTHAIDFAGKNGLNRIRLDTMRKSESALIVFKKYGFYEIPKYNANDVAEIFMEKTLRASAITK